jgi:peptidoglycan L-alanyl-D-glutamate endopeptidase CwlK
MTIEEMIREVQSKLGVDVDGKAGPKTWAAIHAHLTKPRASSRPVMQALSPVDPRSEKAILTLQPEVQPLARALVQKAALHGIQIRIISGLRSYAEQDELYAQGRSKPGDIVTKVRGGYSNHNFGIAFDVGVFEGNRYLGSSPKYKAVGALGKELGLEWGGSWKNFVDEPHFQLRPGWASDVPEKAMLAELRLRSAQGKAIYA